MGDPVLMTVVGVGAALTKMFLRACDVASAADLIGDGQELLGTLSRLSHRSDGVKDQIDRSVSKALAARIQEIHKHRCGQDIDRQLLSGVCTEVEILLNEIANDGELVLSAALNPDNLPAVFHSHASQRRLNVEEAAEPYFDELVEAVAAEYSALAPWSPRFQIEAFKSILSGVDEIQENSRRSLQAHEMTHEMLDTVLSNLAEVTRHEDKAARILFGSRPDVTTGSRFVARVEQDQLDELITDTTKQRTVLVGMRGCGKTQLAAALAQECEDAEWSLVAWVHAGSPESITSGLVELAKELKIDTSDQPTQEQIVGRCLNYLRSSGGSDRLIVFDNVEDINDLRGFVPTGEGLRVVATTTNDKGWNYQGWDPIRIGVFDRETSIDYLLTVTNSADREAAYTLAERLGDLPLALTQAAASARNGDLSLARYMDRLDSYGSERAIRPAPGDYYTDDVATVLWMAVEAAVDSMKNGTKQMARRQLGALALLAESGVPTRWLDPTVEQQDNQELQSADQAEDEDAHDALTELIHRSIVQQSADGTTIMLHRLQAQALRNSWNNNELDDARAAATGLLGSVNISRYPTNDTKARRQEALDLVDQLRSIGTQEHSQVLFESPHISEALFQAFSHASDLGLPYEALTLDVAVDALEGLLGPDHPDTLASCNNLAGAYESAGRLTEAITLYEQVLT
ncbi:tetratricopeptide repeat protein, partial [Xylanimonas cellulosilytica]|uniref:tetratricopeptide repeat protein n=1 Tax=Xylanimonas cellulosilytica TaxID=186189 RepID=UPI00128E06B8